MCPPPEIEEFSLLWKKSQPNLNKFETNNNASQRKGKKWKMRYRRRWKGRGERMMKIGDDYLVLSVSFAV